MGTIADMFRKEGLEQDIILGRQELLIKSLMLKYDVIKPHIIEEIKSIQSLEILDKFFELKYKCSTLDEFTIYLNEYIDN
ncbi:MAG TPA: hypothetical protein ENN79_02230 [Desulfobacteraceae bacterium]|nr:hypothetical protein [Desulfobacteraceae bacterium]